MGLNLLLLGAILGLFACHTRPAWDTTWRHWMAGSPFLALPIATIVIAPVALWGWSFASHQWRRWLAIPNLLLTGLILWWILDRMRPLWTDAWEFLWGVVPLPVNPAILIPLLPAAVWGWRKASKRWPEYWGAARAALWGGILW